MLLLLLLMLMLLLLLLLMLMRISTSPRGWVERAHRFVDCDNLQLSQRGTHGRLAHVTSLSATVICDILRA